jgi:hypothetical protein
MKPLRICARHLWFALAMAAPLAAPITLHAQTAAAPRAERPAGPAAAAAPTAAAPARTAPAAPATTPAATPAAAPATGTTGERADRADLDRTQIIGNRELPKVLYIVPWKKPLHGTMGGRAVTGVVDEALAPIDRDVLRRQVSYDAQIRQSVAAAAGSPVPAANAAAPATPTAAPK